MYTRRIRVWFNASGLAFAVVTIAMRLMPHWPWVPGIRECFLIVIDAAIVYGAVWAAGWGLASSYQDVVPSVRLKEPRHLGEQARRTLPAFTVGGFMAVQSYAAVQTWGISSPHTIGVMAFAAASTLIILWLVMRSE
jgi:hypothetical protein